MDLKLIFVAVVVVATLYNAEVNSYDGKFAIFVRQKFNIRRDELFRFVTYPAMMDKWLHWIYFITEADHKPFSEGKLFKVWMSDGMMVFKVTDFENGRFVALESNTFFHPRIEFRFVHSDIFKNANKTQEIKYENEKLDCNSQLKSSQLELRLQFKRRSAIFQYTVGVILRNIFQTELRRSLKNLEAILNESSRVPGIFP